MMGRNISPAKARQQTNNLGIVVRSEYSPRRPRKETCVVWMEQRIEKEKRVETYMVRGLLFASLLLLTRLLLGIVTLVYV